MHVSTFEPKQFWKFEDERLIGLTGSVGLGSKLVCKVKEINKITGEVVLGMIA